MRPLLSLGYRLYRHTGGALNRTLGTELPVTGAGPSVPALRLEHVSQHFGDVRAVDDVSLEIAEGEFFAMLGPSGSGKTTCLRLIAGFEHPTSGPIEIHVVSADGLPPFSRNVNTVFQDYALFPHMNVRDNVAYGLMVRGRPRRERYVLAEEMLALVKLEGLSQRKPAELSGGQRQRVALARALINKPRVLLLDEPLGALDLKLRQEMQLELKALQRRLAITLVFVTLDQEEAPCMSERLAVFNHGKVEQLGSPRQIYERPETPFVAGFVGISNVVDGTLAVKVGGPAGGFTIRPEKVVLDRPGAVIGEGFVVVTGTLGDVQYQGATSRYQVVLDMGAELVVVRQNNRELQASASMARGERVLLSWHPGDAQAIRGSG